LSVEFGVFITAMIGAGLEDCRPSQPQVADINPVHGVAPRAAVGGRKSTSFHGADDAVALQGIGQRWPSARWQR